MSQLKVNSIIPSGGLPSGASGGIIQSKTVTKTDTYTTTSATFGDVTGLSVSITPQSSSNKILVIANIHFGCTNSQNAMCKLVRGSTDICIGDAAGNRTRCTGFKINNYDNDPTMVSVSFLDSPATTSSTTYKWQVRRASGGTCAVNRGGGDSDTSNNFRTASTITLLEISG